MKNIAILVLCIGVNKNLLDIKKINEALKPKPIILKMR